MGVIFFVAVVFQVIAGHMKTASNKMLLKTRTHLFISSHAQFSKMTSRPACLYDTVIIITANTTS